MKLSSSPNWNASVPASIAARSAPSSSTSPKTPSSRSAACSSALRCAATCAGESGAAVVELAERRDEDEAGRERGSASGGGRGRTVLVPRRDEEVEGARARRGLLAPEEADAEGVLAVVVGPDLVDEGPSLEGGCIPPRIGALDDAVPAGRLAPGVLVAVEGARGRRGASAEPGRALRADPAAVEPETEAGKRVRLLVLEAREDELAGLTERGARRFGAGKKGCGAAAAERPAHGTGVSSRALTTRKRAGETHLSTR